MKKLALVVVAMVVVVSPILAGATLINVGYNVHAFEAHSYYHSVSESSRGIGPVFTFFAGRKNGFYAQLAPFAITDSAYFTPGYWFPADYARGLNLVLGYGRDINFGKMGILLGGGPFASGLLLTYLGHQDDIRASVGAGAGAHYYFSPGSGRLVLNAGVNVAWRPFSIGNFHDPTFAENEYNYNINAGIGFRR